MLDRVKWSFRFRTKFNKYLLITGGMGMIDV